MTSAARPPIIDPTITPEKHKVKMFMICHRLVLSSRKLQRWFIH